MDKNNFSETEFEKTALAAANLAATKIFKGETYQDYNIITESVSEEGVVTREIFVNYSGPLHNFLVVELRGIPGEKNVISWKVEGICTPGNRAVLKEEELEKLSKDCKNG